MRRFRPPAIKLGLQIAKMKQDFPNFTYSRKKNVPTWYGPLQPTEDSPVYTAKIAYRFANRKSRPPKVWIVFPELHPDVLHRYPDKSLCLYYPHERSWTPYKFISETIVPWTALWLAFYEVWLDTDYWYGPEAPHKGKKQR
jgi:hypothetical protein